MAKRNKKGGWTGTSAGSNAVKSGGGPQVDSWLRPKQPGKKYSTGQKIGRAVVFLLICVLAGSLIYQATPQNMAEYWGVGEQKDSITKVEIVSYDENGAAEERVLEDAAEIEAFCTALDESRLKRLWFAGQDSAVFTDSISIYADGAETPSFEAGLVEDRVYFLGMPTYDWYLDETEPLMVYLD